MEAVPGSRGPVLLGWLRDRRSCSTQYVVPLRRQIVGTSGEILYAQGQQYDEMNSPRQHNNGSVICTWHGDIDFSLVNKIHIILSCRKEGTNFFSNWDSY